MKQLFDAIIIGFGKGGKTLAGYMANKGLKIALIEKSTQMYGGTCINKACIPTKKLEHIASDIRSKNLKTMEEKNEAYKKAIEEKEILISQLREANYQKLNSNKNITIFTGFASFIDEYTVQIESSDGTVEKLEAKQIFVNTGTEPFVPQIKGIETVPTVYTSDEILQLKTLPSQLTIIGAGFIGLEFAGIYSGFGSEVTVLDTEEQILSHEDADDRDEVLKILGKKGVKVIGSAKIKEIRENGDKNTITYEKDGESIELLSDAILMATGRKPATQGLNLKQAGIEVNERGFIKVSDTLRTTKEHIWAIGDVNGGLQFTYISLDDYRIIIDHLFGEKQRRVTDRKTVPTVLFLDPPFSRVGLNVRQAQAKGHNVEVAKMPVAAIPRAKQIGKTDGFLKVIIDKDTKKILGASMLSEESSELIHLIQMAIDFNADYTYLRDNIYAHPTMAEAFNDLLSMPMIQSV